MAELDSEGFINHDLPEKIIFTQQAKILLLEDDDRQIEWARQTLQGHELTVMKAFDRTEFEKLVSGTNFVLTDLMLPEAKDDKVGDPDWRVGMEVYRLAVKLLKQGKIKGVALLSNFEHHAHDMITEKTAYEIHNLLRQIQGDFGEYKDVLWHQVVSVSYKPDSLNCLSVFDNMPLPFATFMDKEGRLRKRKPGEDKYKLADKVKDEGWVILKPYSQVMATLLL